MKKLIELFIIFAVIAVPAQTARNKDARKGFRKMVYGMLLCDAFYLFLMRFVHGHFT